MARVRGITQFYLPPANTEVLHSTDIFGFLNVDEKEKAAKFFV